VRGAGQAEEDHLPFAHCTASLPCGDTASPLTVRLWEMAMRSFWLVVASVSAGCWASTSLFAAADASTESAAPVTPVALEADARLASIVSVHESGVSLAGIFRSLSRADLELSCDRSCAEQKVQVHLRARPLRSVMAAVAEWLPGEWVPDEKRNGYRLRMAADAVAHRERWWQLYLAERDRALDQLRADVLRSLRAAPLPPARNPNQQLQSEQYAETLFYRSLPGTLQEQIAQNLIPLASYRLPPISVGFAYVDEGATRVPVAALPPVVREQLATQHRLFITLQGGDAAWARAVVRFSNVGTSVVPSIVMPNGEWSGVPWIRGVRSGTATAVLSLDHARLASEVRRLGARSPVAWRELAAFQQRRVWTNDLPPGIGASLLPTRRVEVLRWLSEQAKVDFVADYYSLPSIPMERGARERKPSPTLPVELNRFAAEQDCSWRRQPDGIYLVRHNRWYRNDRLEVPERMLGRLLALAGQQSRPGGQVPPSAAGNPAIAVYRQLEWEAAASTSLTPWQIGNGLAWHAVEAAPAPASGQSGYERRYPYGTYYPFILDAERVLRQTKLLRFYSSLRPDDRLRLPGNRLPFETLSATQQEMALELLPAVPDGTRAGVALGLRQESPSGVITHVLPGPGQVQMKPELRLILLSPDVNEGTENAP
jgi:hypothetical protein